MSDPGHSTAAEDEYASWARRWQKLWERLDAVSRVANGWTAPWLDESWRDGNPIFSAWSPSTRRGIRILTHPAGSDFLVWRDSFGDRGSPDAVQEIVISCAMREESLWRAEEILEQWILGRAVIIYDEPMAALDFDHAA